MPKGKVTVLSTCMECGSDSLSMILFFGLIGEIIYKLNLSWVFIISKYISIKI